MTTRLEAAISGLAAAIRQEVRAEVERVKQAPDKLLSMVDAAALLGVARSTLYVEVYAGRLRSLKVGRRRLIPSSALAEYVNAQPK